MQHVAGAVGAVFDMNLLWERYVAALFRRVATSKIVVNTQERHPFWSPPSYAIRNVRPDIVVRAEPHNGPGRTLLVIDTKWKVQPKGLPSDDDLKQMFVYNELLKGGRSILLYPATETSFQVTGPYAQRTHSCEQFFLGLFDAQGWSTKAMQGQLANLLETTEETGEHPHG